MQQSELDVTIGSLVTERISRSRVFERYGLDYCCGGKVALGEACKKKGLDCQEVLTALRESDVNEKGVDSTDWRAASLTELANHIEATHHAYLNGELPRLSQLMEKVVNAHSKRYPDLVKVAETLEALREELTQHMAKEEQILFPLIRQIDSNGPIDFHCGSVVNPIGVMEHEHNNAGQALDRLRSLTQDYQVPDKACNTYRALLAGLAELELDLHQHIHKENNILFSRAIALEQELMQR